MKFYLHKIAEGYLMNQNLRSVKSGTIFSSEGGAFECIRALSNTEDIEIQLVKTYK